MQRMTLVALCLLVLGLFNGVQGRAGGPAQRRQLLGLTPTNPVACNSPKQCRNTNLNSVAYCLNDLSKSCGSNANFNCGPCSLFQRLATRCDQHSCDDTVLGTRQCATHHEWLAEPSVPVTGIERILDGSGDAATKTIWEDAWTAATGGQLDNQGNYKLPPSDLGLAINSYGYRGQHQFHVHIARLDSKFAKCLQGLSFQGSWAANTNCKVDAQKGEMTVNTLTFASKTLDRVNSHIKDGATKAASDWGLTMKDLSKRLAVVITSNKGSNAATRPYYITLINSVPQGHQAASIGDYGVLFHDDNC